MRHVGKSTVNETIHTVKTNRINIGDITLVGNNYWISNIREGNWITWHIQRGISVITRCHRPDSLHDQITLIVTNKIRDQNTVIFYLTVISSSHRAITIDITTETNT